jgi:hypothetical protein
MRTATKHDFDLPRLLKGARGYQLHSRKFKSNFFVQLSFDGFVRLFSCFNEATRDAPTRAGSKAVSKQQYSSLRVHYDSCSCNGETRVRQAHGQAAQHSRDVTPDSADKILEHLTKRIA